jgi:AraC-like DNA-binding protein
MMNTELNHPILAESLFDVFPQVVFFVKDMSGRYSHVNHGLMTRCGKNHKEELLGKLPNEVFPPHLGRQYEQQDQQVLEEGRDIKDYLELHVYPNGNLGWCITNKIALYDDQNQIVGLSGTSRDLGCLHKHNTIYQQIADAVKWIDTHYSEPISMRDLEKQAKLSTAQIERYFYKIFTKTPRQFITQVRLESAKLLLAKTTKCITDIAVSSGYQDHSAFSRVFKVETSMTPSQYRELKRKLCNSRDLI